MQVIKLISRIITAMIGVVSVITGVGTALTGCLAVILTVPAPTMVTVLSKIVATFGSELEKTIWFPDAPPVADTLKSGSPKTLSVKTPCSLSA